MTDPLAKESSRMNSLKFAKLYSPKMKSVYWTYFGFPTNEDDRIITKQNVVCTLCHRVLTNHGNTTNLRAHLQYRHKDVFQRICLDNDIKIPPRKVGMIKSSPTHTTRRAKRKIKLEIPDISASESEQIIGIDNDQLYESEIPMTYEDDDDIEREHFSTVEVIKEEGKNFRKHKTITSQGEMAEYAVIDKKFSSPAGSQQYQLDVIEECDPFQLQELLVNMFVQDLRNVRSLNDPGFSHLLKTISGTNVLPSVQKIEDLIREMHSDKHTTLSVQIKAHSQEKPYSLGFDVWLNVEKRHYVTVYYNYTTEIGDYSKLLNQLYCTFEYNTFTSLETIFEEFNLDNCTAAVVNYDYDDYLKQFLKNKKIPIVLAYDTTLDKCVRDVLALPSVAPFIEEIKETVLRYLSEISSRDVEVPWYNDEFPWTYYEFLKFFTEAVVWPEDVKVMVTTAKAIVEELTTLSQTLDMLRAEEVPLSSMLSPITGKVLGKHYKTSEGDESFVIEIKKLITKTLNKFVTQNDHFTIAAILDPRFIRYMNDKNDMNNMNNFNRCTKILTEKYSKLCITDGFSVVRRPEQIKTPNTSARKSNLEILFDIEDAENVISENPEEQNVESDLKRYQKEVQVTLHESPLVWWQKMGHVYGTIKQLADSYLCVPCTTNVKFIRKPLSQQIYEIQQRYMLSGNIVDAMMFLHHNK